MATNGSGQQTSGNVRTYRGRTLDEILPKIRTELGPDAIILREREGLLGGVGGFFAQRFIEVDARRGDGQSIDIYDDAPESDLRVRNQPTDYEVIDRRASAPLLEDPEPRLPPPPAPEPRSREPRRFMPPQIESSRPAPARAEPPREPAAAPPRRFETDVFMERLREASAAWEEEDEQDDLLPALPSGRATPPPAALPDFDPEPLAEPEPQEPPPTRTRRPAPKAKPAPEPKPRKPDRAMLKAEREAAKEAERAARAAAKREEREAARAERLAAREREKSVADANAAAVAAEAAVERGRAAAAEATERERLEAEATAERERAAAEAAERERAEAEATAEREHAVAEAAERERTEAEAAERQRAAIAAAVERELAAANAIADAAVTRARAAAAAQAPPKAAATVEPVASPAAAAPTPPPPAVKRPRTPPSPPRSRPSSLSGNGQRQRPVTPRPAAAMSSAAPAPAVASGPQPVGNTVVPFNALRPDDGVIGALQRIVGSRRRTVPRSATAKRLDPQAVAAVVSELSTKGASEAFATQLITVAGAHGGVLRGGLREAAEAEVARRIVPAPDLPPAGAAIAFIGAGGSGKTSCTAALASAYRRDSTLPVSVLALESTDRGGELRKLLGREGVPVVAQSLERARRTIDKGRDGGVVIVDTPAVTPTDADAVAALGRTLEALGLDAVYVALPATLGPQAARRALASFGSLRPSAIAITHADETDQLAVSLEIAISHRIPLAYLHAGTDHRNALSPVDPAAIAQHLLP